MTRSILYIHQPTELQCGQAVLAMLAGVSVEQIVTLLHNDRETALKEMLQTLSFYDIPYHPHRKEAHHKAELPACALLSLETPRCWHWSLYADERFYDPEHGILDDFPESNRKFYWELYP